MFQGIEHVVLEQFLVRYTHFNWLPCRTVLTVPLNNLTHTQTPPRKKKVSQEPMLDSQMLVISSPVLDQRDINGTPCATRSEVEGSWCPQKSNAIGCVVCVEWSLFEERLDILREFKLLIVIWQRLLALNTQQND